MIFVLWCSLGISLKPGGGCVDLKLVQIFEIKISFLFRYLGIFEANQKKILVRYLFWRPGRLAQLGERQLLNPAIQGRFSSKPEKTCLVEKGFSSPWHKLRNSSSKYNATKRFEMTLER